MLRKITCALAGVAAISTATLAPSSASAWGWHAGHRGAHVGAYGRVFHPFIVRPCNPFGHSYLCQ
jgi:hypothetical protein